MTDTPSTPALKTSAPTAALLASAFVVATCGLVYELLASTLASYLLGDSVTQFSTVIGCYLFAMGIGSWLAIVTLAAALPGCSTDDIANDYEALMGGAGSSSTGGTSSAERDEPRASAQGVLWLELADADAGACSSMRSFEEPAGAKVTITTTANGERVVDGAGAAVECRVVPRAGAEDVFDLSAMDAISATIGTEHLTFIGTAEFSAPGQVRYEKSGLGSTFVTLNVDGADNPEGSFSVAGLHDLTEADFIL